MKYKFKTNINCGGCIAKVTPFLDGENSIESWEVDTKDPKKILIVETESLKEDEVVKIVEGAGFKAEPLKKGFFKGLF